MWSETLEKMRIVYLIYLSLLSFADATPLAPAPAPASETHVISFVTQKKTNAKYAEINDFDFESFGDTARDENYFSMNGAIEQFFGRFLLSPIQNSTNNKQNILAKLQRTDDLLSSAENTLESTNSIFDKDEQHESSKNSNESSSNLYNRFKLSIPALKPVRDLLNTVREGGLNNTNHLNKSRHHLVKPGEVDGMGGNGESSAIETEEDRETASHSASFNVIDFLGTIGSMIWGFIMNLLAASSSNGSAASSIG